MGDAKTKEDMLTKLEQLIEDARTAECSERRLNTKLNDDFVRAWLGQSKIRKDEIRKLLPAKFRAATVHEVIFYLRQESLKKAA